MSIDLEVQNNKGETHSTLGKVENRKNEIDVSSNVSQCFTLRFKTRGHIQIKKPYQMMYLNPVIKQSTFLSRLQEMKFVY